MEVIFVEGVFSHPLRDLSIDSYKAHGIPLRSRSTSSPKPHPKKKALAITASALKFSGGDVGRLKHIRSKNQGTGCELCFADTIPS